MSEKTQELQHWGIKGQKWGIRRYQNADGTLTAAGKKRYYYQNPDGSLTEEGRKNYMTAAKKGKLDYNKLSDKDLDMINNRFNKENQYKRNVENYEKSTFSYKLKDAVITRIKGNNGGGGGGKKGSKLGSLLLMPIKKAFSDAFKDSGNSGKGKDNDDNDEDEKKNSDDEDYERYVSNGHRFVSGYSETSSEIKERHQRNGRYILENTTRNWGYSNDGSKYNDGKSGEYTTNTYSTAEDVLRRRRSSSVAHSIQFVVRRTSKSDELMHFGILGQKWGVRRYENADGTLTKAGKERYQKSNLKELKKIAKETRNAETYKDSFFVKARKVLPKEKMKDVIDAAEDYYSKFSDSPESDPASDDYYFKKGGLNDKINSVIDDVLGKYKKKFSNTSMHRLVNFAVTDAIEKKKENEKSFNNSKDKINKEGMNSWWLKTMDTKDEKSFFDHVFDTQKSLLDSWDNEKDKMFRNGRDSSNWDSVQRKYTKKLASNLGIAQTKENLSYLSYWFINGDD